VIRKRGNDGGEYLDAAKATDSRVEAPTTAEEDVPSIVEKS
jgi:hypothetical protein